jgi:hypothetical protein
MIGPGPIRLQILPLFIDPSSASPLMIFCHSGDLFSWVVSGSIFQPGSDRQDFLAMRYRRPGPGKIRYLRWHDMSIHRCNNFHLPEEDTEAGIIPFLLAGVPAAPFRQEIQAQAYRQ